MITHQIDLFFHLLLGTMYYRPYVYLFLLCFLVFSISHLGMRGTFIFSVIAYLIAFLSEYSSTRNGFPFGKYSYIDEMRNKELWISNVPFWDSLSFVFLTYFSWLVACGIRNTKSPGEATLELKTAFISGLLMMILDVVIDPLTLLGDQWFLGNIYFYPVPGPYFGVTLENFAGWYFVGFFTIFCFQQLCRRGIGLQLNKVYALTHQHCLLAFLVYSGVFIFNLAITAWIGQWNLFLSSLLVAVGTTGICAGLLLKNKRLKNGTSDPALCCHPSRSISLSQCNSTGRIRE
jgi:putative membrane protein